MQLTNQPPCQQYTDKITFISKEYTAQQRPREHSGIYTVYPSLVIIAKCPVLPKKNSKT